MKQRINKNADHIFKEKNRKMLVTIVAGVLLFLLYAMIFSFSAQDGETSGGLSAYLSEICVELLNAVSGKGWSESFMESLALYFEHPIRKLAHFGEYAVMGILVFIMLGQWQKCGRRLYLTVILWVLVSAAGDELHQLFVPGRYSSILDVLLDTAGGCFGLICMVLLKRMRNRKKRIKQ